MTKEQKFAFDISLIFVSQTPLVGGILSQAIRIIALLPEEPKGLGEEEVKRLIKNASISEMVIDLKAKVRNSKDTIKNLEDSKDDLTSKGFIEIFNEKLAVIEGYKTDFTKDMDAYDNEKTFYTLPYFVIWAKCHLLLLRMKVDLTNDASDSKAHMHTFKKTTLDYAKRLYNSFKRTIKWRLNQLVYPSPPSDNIGDWENDFNDNAEPNNTYRVKVPNSDMERIADYYGSDRGDYGFWNFMKSLKNRWGKCIKTAYNHTTGIESILENWLYVYSDKSIPEYWDTNWREQILENTFNTITKCVKIRALRGGRNNKYLSHAGRNVSLVDGYKGHGELF